MTDPSRPEKLAAQARAAVDERTIADFGEQWTTYRDNSDYYGSVELLADIFGPLTSLAEVAGKDVAEIGSGTGRIVNVLLDAGAARVTAIEPSQAFEVLVRNTAGRSERVYLVRGRGEALPVDTLYDFVVSIGVLHHITDPAPVVRRVATVLKPGGKFLAWLYGQEGNEAYLAFVRPLRAVTKRLPHRMLAGLCYPLDWTASAYAGLARVISLPMRDYMTKVYGRLPPDKRRLVMYDQLNSTLANLDNAEESAFAG